MVRHAAVVLSAPLSCIRSRSLMQPKVLRSVWQHCLRFPGDYFEMGAACGKAPTKSQRRMRPPVIAPRIFDSGSDPEECTCCQLINKIDA